MKICHIKHDLYRWRSKTFVEKGDFNKYTDKVANLRHKLKCYGFRMSDGRLYEAKFKEINLNEYYDDPAARCSTIIKRSDKFPP